MFCCSAPLPDDGDYEQSGGAKLVEVSPRGGDDAKEELAEADYGDDDEDLSDAGVWGRQAINPRCLDDASEVDVEDFGFAVRTEEELKGDPLFQTEEDDGGECFMAVKPWLGAIHKPDDAPSNNPAAPDATLELEWVYGYRGHDSRSNVKVNTEGQLVYPAAGVVVKYDFNKHRQEHFQGHTDDVVCLAQNPANPDIVASGQVATIVNRRATLPHLCVWNTKTGEKWTMPKLHKRAIRNLCFSPDGKYIASVGNDNNYTIIVWDWQNQTAVAVEKSGTDEMSEMEWNPVNANQFVVAGKKCVWFCTFDGSSIKRQRGAFGSNDRAIFYAISFTPKGYTITGSSKGQLYIWVNGRCSKVVKLHKGPIYTLLTHTGADGESYILSGGKDNLVKVMSTKLKVLQEIKLDGKIRALYIHQDKQLFVGTNKSEIYCFEDFRSLAPSTPIVWGHYNGETWALDAHPREANEFASVGEDNAIIVWDLKGHKARLTGLIDPKKGKSRRRRQAGTTSTEPPNRCARAIAYSPDGEHIAIGTNKGFLRVYSAKDLSLVASVNLNSQSKRKVKNQTENWIQDMKYSPDGRCLAVGTHGIAIALCDVRNGYKPAECLKAHNAAISHLDWTADSDGLQSNCIAYELLFHDITPDIKGSSQNPHSSQYKNKKWASQTCVLGWAVQGIFDPHMDGTDVNSACVSPDGTLLATGDDFGQVNLYRYPCAEKLNGRHTYPGHSSHVVNVRFSVDGRYLLSTGGNDKTVMQWRVC